MIIVKMDAGLGNQMLEHCFYRKLKDEYPGLEIKVDLDRYILKKYLPHNGFELPRVFSINYEDIATTEEIIRCGGPYQRHKNGPADLVTKYYYMTVQKLRRASNVYRVNQRDWDDFAAGHKSDLKDIDCWVENCWFTLYEPAITDFGFAMPLTGPNEEAALRMGKCESVSVHIRRGDYVGASIDVLKKNYYMNAIEYMKSRLSAPAFFFFSDDPEYVKSEYGELKVPYEIIDLNKGNDSHFDLQLMSRCKNHIICNSSFSLWGAVLDKNPDKIIFKPDMLSDDLAVGGGIWVSADNDGNNVRGVKDAAS